MLAPQAREGCARLCDARLKLGIRRAPGASDPSIIPRGFVTLAQSLRHTGALEHERHGVIVQPLPHPRRSRVKTSAPTSPTAKNAIVYFVSSPIPIHAPIPNHQRPSSELISRITQYSASTHHK